MQGLHSLLPVYMKKIPCRVHAGSRQPETKNTGCQNPTHHWVRVASAHLRSKRGCIHADVSSRRLLSMSSSFAKNNLEWVSEKSIQYYWGKPHEGRGAGDEAIASISKETQEP